MKLLSLAFAITTLILIGCGDPQPPKGYVVERGELRAEFRGNVHSDGEDWLSGVTRLQSTRGEGNAWDKEGAGDSGTRQAVGLNFEHVASTYPDARNDKAPRKGPMSMEPLEDGSGVTLHRRAEDSPWGVEATITYRVVEPYYIDMDFDAVVTKAAEFGERRTAVFFFASYMGEAAGEEDGGTDLHFRGVPGPGGQEQWERTRDPFGETLLGVDALGASLMEPDNLTSGHRDWPRLTKPVVYGRRANGFVFAYMVDRLVTNTEETAFTVVKWKLAHGGERRPAWDFAYRVRDLVDGQHVGFRARALWKPWESREDILAEFERWAPQ